MASRKTETPVDIIANIERGVNTALAEAKKLIPMLPAMDVDDIRQQRIINQLREIVHTISGDQGLDFVVRNADRIARRGARKGSAVA